MIPVEIKFRGGEVLNIFSTKPAEFAASVEEVSPPEIESLSYSLDTNASEPTPDDLQETKITLESGGIIVCYVSKSIRDKIHFIEGVESVEDSTIIAYAKLAKEEQALDERWGAVQNVMNNIPDKKLRLYLHKEYLKRRRAFVAVVEALIEGVIRRPSE